MGYPALPGQIVEVPDLSLLGDFSFGAILQLPILTVALLVFTLVLTDYFDSIGTLTGLGKEAGSVRPDGTLPGAGRALTVDALGAVAGGVASSSSNTVYIESAAGIAEGARTGLANVVTGILFLVATFFSDFAIALPAFLTIVVMPFTYSIANGIGAGFISWVLLHAVTGRARGIHH